MIDQLSRFKDQACFSSVLAKQAMNCQFPLCTRFSHSQRGPSQLAESSLVSAFSKEQRSIYRRKTRQKKLGLQVENSSLRHISVDSVLYKLYSSTLSGLRRFVKQQCISGFGIKMKRGPTHAVAFHLTRQIFPVTGHRQRLAHSSRHPRHLIWQFHINLQHLSLAAALYIMASQLRLLYTSPPTHIFTPKSATSQFGLEISYC